MDLQRRSKQPLTEPDPTTTGVPEPTLVPDTAPPGAGPTPTDPASLPTEVMPPAAHGAAPPRPALPGYRLVQPLGAGSYGEVWRAEEEGTGIVVAVKFFARGGQQVQPLLAEVRQLARLDSVPGIVQLKAVHPGATPPCFVMAYAPGGSLADRLEQGPLPLDEALAVIRQVAEALAYVHAKGIRHCDLKPGNVLLDARGRAVLADFGQAHLMGDVSPALGTLFYMAPEQAALSLQVPDARWDVYGLGSLLVQMLTGRPAHYDERVLEHLGDTLDMGHRLGRYREWLHRAPPETRHRRVPGVDRDLDAIIRRCLEIDPARRFRDAAAVLEALDARERRRKQRPVLAFMVAVPLVLLTILAWSSAQSRRRALEAFENDLTAQLLEGDRDSARSIALAVQEQLQERVAAVRRTADWELYDALRRRHAPDLRARLRRLLARDGEPGEKFAAAVVADARGRLIAGVRVQPANGGGREMIDITPGRYPQYRHWAWRDWFCGRTGEVYHPQRTPAPITSWHISAPYVSPEFPGEMMVGLSCPVRDPVAPRSAPAGVLLASIRTRQLSRWFRQVGVATGGFVVLLDRRRHCVLHDAAAASPSPLGAPRVLDHGGLPVDRASDRTGTAAELHDPIDGKTYLAGYAHTPDDRIGWVALVQHDREAVRRPIAALRAGLEGIRWRTFAAAGGLTAGLWCVLFWLLRRGEPARGV